MPVRADPALPSGGVVASGAAEISTPTSSSLAINQSSQNAIINWGDFSIGAGGTVQIDNGSGATLNRVVGDNISRIDGSLSATGDVFLINQNGVIVGSEGIIETGGRFVASTLDLEDSDFLSGGDLTFRGNRQTEVLNLGRVSSLGGDVALIGHSVTNAGEIEASSGTVGLVAGREVLMRDNSLDDGMFAVKVGGDDTAVTNTGNIKAAEVELRANGGNVYALAGNTGSDIQATAVAQKGGRIFLTADGGSVVSTGRLKARRTPVPVQAPIPADRPTNYGGGKIFVDADHVTIRGTIDVAGVGGAGGEIDIGGKHITIETATLDASGTTGGRIRLGGEYRGGYDLISDEVRNASTLHVAADTSIFANASTAQGAGGRVIMWSEDETSFYGTVVNKGINGDESGGFTEVSAKDMLIYQGRVDTGGGTLLIDPRNIEITDGSATLSGASTVSTASIIADLASNNVVITTTGSDAGETGIIRVSSDLIYDRSRSLSLVAHSNIEVMASIQNRGAGGINLVAGWSGAITYNTTLFKNADLATTTYYGNNSAEVRLNGATRGVAVGSMRGETNVFTGFLRLTAGAPGSSFNPSGWAQIGFRTVNEGTRSVTGGINVKAKNSVRLESETIHSSTSNASSYAQIGHGGGQPQTNDTDPDANITASISVEAQSSITLITGEENFNSAQIGHGGNYFQGSAQGDITVRSNTGSVNLIASSENAQRTTMIGHGGAGSDGNRFGNISVFALSEIYMFAGSDTQNAPVQIGHGGWRSQGTQIGNITLESGGDMELVALGNAHSYVQVGHGSLFPHETSGARAGDITIRAVRELTIDSRVSLAGFDMVQLGHFTTSSGLGNTGALTIFVSTVSDTWQASVTSGEIADTDVLNIATAITRGDVTIGLTDSRFNLGHTVYSSSYDLTLLTTFDINLTQDLNNTRATDGGDITVVAGWDGTTETTYSGAFIAQSSSAAAASAATAFGQNGQDVWINGRELGSRSGATRVFGNNILVGGLATSGNFDRFSMIGFRAKNQGSGYLVTGSITAVAKGNISLQAGGNAVMRAQIGHGSWGGADSIIDATITSPITVFAGGNIELTGSGDSLAQVQIGHGGIQFNGTLHGAVDVQAHNNITLTEGSGSRAYALIGHGGADFQFGDAGTGSRSGAISVTAAGEISLIGTNPNKPVWIGHASQTPEVDLNFANIIITAAAIDTSSSSVSAGGQSLVNISMLSNMLIGGDVTIRTTNSNLSLSNAFSYSRTHNLTLMASHDLDLDHGLQNSHQTGGDINLVAGWDGSTSYSTIVSQVTTLATLQSTSAFGNNSGFIDILGSAVGSRGGQTSAWGDAVRMLAGSTNGQYAMLGFRMEDLGLSYEATGSIDVRAKDFVVVSASSTGSLNFAQIGHGGYGNQISVADGNTSDTATISVWAGTNVSLASRSVNAAQIGHGGFLADGHYRGDMYIQTGGHVIVSAESAGSTGGYAQIGHGGADFSPSHGSGNRFGNIQIDAGDVVSVQDHISNGARGWIGHATQNEPLASVTSDISITAFGIAKSLSGVGFAGTGLIASDMLAYGLRGGDVTLMLTNSGLTIDANNEYNGKGDLTIMATHDIIFNNAFMNNHETAGIGAINLIAGWDGTTAFNSTTFDGLDLVSQTVFGRNSASVIVGSGSQTTWVAVGSRSSNTRVYANNLSITAATGSDFRYGMLGFRPRNDGAGYIVSGDINVRVKGSVTLTSATAYDIGYAQIGHVGGDNDNNTAISATVSNANISVEAGGSILLNALSGSETHVQIGHGGFGGRGNFSGNITVSARSNLTLNAGNGNQGITDRDVYAQIGHGGAYADGNHSGDITVDVLNILSLNGGNVIGDYAQIGHGGTSANGNLSGAINVHSNSRIILSPGTAEGTFAQIGHGTPNYSSSEQPTGNRSGDITVTVPFGEIRMEIGTQTDNPSFIGHATRADSTVSNANITLTAEGFGRSGVFLTTGAQGELVTDIVQRGLEGGNVSITSTRTSILLTGTVDYSGSNDLIINASHDVVLQSGIRWNSSGAGDVTLVAGRHFLNNDSSSSALQDGTGRLLVYSSTYTTHTRGALSGSNLYGQTFAGLPPASVSGTTNRFIFADQPTLTITADNKSRQYGNANPALTYSVSGLVHGDTQGTATSGAPTLSTSASSTSDVGSYTITADAGTLSSSIGYLINYVDGSLSVTQRSLTVDAVAKSKTYGNSDPSLTYTTSGLVNGDTFSGGLTRVSGEDVGTYTINQGTLSAGSNYSLSFTASTLTINRRAITVSANARAKTYGNADPSLTYTISGLGLVNDDTLSGALARDSGENVGDYTIRQGTLSASSNYTLTFNTNTLTINRRAITVSANARTKIYGDADPSLTYTISGPGLVSGDSLSGSLSRVSGENAGSYAIQQNTLSAGSNYTLTFNDNTLTINRAALTITANDDNKTYNGVAYTGGNDVDYAGFVNGETASVLGGSLSYGGTAQNAVNAGSYVLTASGLTSGNYDITYVDGTLTVDQATLTITSTGNQSKIYGETDPVLNYTPTGLIGSDTISGALGRVAGENVGTYNFTSGDLSAGANYDVSFVLNHHLEITPRTLTVEVTAGQNKVYGSADPVFAYTANGFASGEDISIMMGQLSRNGDNNVGNNYDILVGSLSAGDNYTFDFTGSKFEITPKTLTVDVTADQNKVYGSADPAFAYDDITGWEYTDTITLVSGALGRLSGEDVGLYDYTTGTLSAGGNYTFAINQPNGFEITPKTLTVDVTANQNKVYGSADPTFAYDDITGWEYTDTIALVSGALGRASGEDVGLYDYTTGTLSAGGNYTFAIDQTNKFMITPKTLTVDVTADQNKVYGSADPTFAYDDITGWEYTDTITLVSGALGRVSGQNVGLYDYTTGTLSAGGNYTFVINQPNGFEITPKTLTVDVTANQNKVYGSADPTFAYDDITGWEYTDTVALVSGALGRVSGQNVGLYDYTTGTLSAGGNYTFVINQPNGFEITRKTLTVRANNDNKTYDGLAYTGGNGVDYDGFVNGETSSVLSGTITYGGTAQNAVNVGSYVLTASGQTSGNYDITYVDGTLTIDQATLTVAANDVTKTFDDTPYSGGGGITYRGFVNGEDDSVISGILSWGGSAQGATDFGLYSISVSGLTSDNYAITFVDGTLDIIVETIEQTPPETSPDDDFYNDLWSDNDFDNAGGIGGSRGSGGRNGSGGAGGSESNSRGLNELVSSRNADSQSYTISPELALCLESEIEIDCSNSQAVARTAAADPNERERIEISELRR